MSERPDSDTQPTAPAAGEDGAEERIARMEKELAARETRLNALHDKYLRALADLDNLRKRTRQEVREARIEGMASVLAELLTVVDNFERALEAVGTARAHSKTARTLYDGIKLIHRQLLDLLNKHGVAPIEAIGVPFDPAYHDAAARIATTEAPEGTVVTELQKGYLMGHRVLRPSRVGVAGPPGGWSVEAGENER
jgi:molecular chaperone GrpE